MEQAFSKTIYCTLTWMCEAIKFGVEGRVHFLPFSQQAVISNEFTYYERTQPILHTMIYNNIYSNIFSFLPNTRTNLIFWSWIKKNRRFTWSFLSALESRHRVAFSIFTYSLASSLPLALLFESVNLTWPFDFSESCLSLVSSVASWFSIKI